MLILFCIHFLTKKAMSVSAFKHWADEIHHGKKRAAYLMIADLIASDVDKGLLQTRDQLPTLRELADILSLNYTTVARAYKEAKNRGLIDSHPGLGTFVKGKTSTLPLRGGSDVEMTMNLPPEPSNQALNEKLRLGFEAAAHGDIHAMMRYQDFGGSDSDKLAGLSLIDPFIHKPSLDNILVCPGIHSVLVALLSMLVGNDKTATICVEDYVYPGIKAIAAQLGIKLSSVASDADGALINEIEALCKTENVAAIYINPTIQNPTTKTWSSYRREALADLAMRYSIPIIEDDPYGLLPAQAEISLAKLAPDLTYYINGLAKCFGAGLRIAYLYSPNKILTQRTAGALRSLSVMASPVTNTIATQLINDGTVADMVESIRDESNKRQDIVQHYLSHYKVATHPDSFHLWLSLPKGFESNAAAVASFLRSRGVSAVSSAAFCTNNNPEEAMRVCLGGPGGQWEFTDKIKLIADILEHPGHLSGVLY